MRRSILSFFTFFIFGQSWSQDYTILPINLAAQGNPQFLFFANATLLNNSSSSINLFMERIEKNIPANWSSCFCHPKCVAPFVDTISFSIPPYGQDSITPSFLADSIPGIGTIRVRVYQIGFESQADTIIFTGSTLNWTSANNYTKDPWLSVYPNPCSESITIEGDDRFKKVCVYNATGKLTEKCMILTGQNNSLSLVEYENGIYFLKIELENGIIAFRKFMIIK